MKPKRRFGKRSYDRLVNTASNQRSIQIANLMRMRGHNARVIKNANTSSVFIAPKRRYSFSSYPNSKKKTMPTRKVNFGEGSPSELPSSVKYNPREGWVDGELNSVCLWCDTLIDHHDTIVCNSNFCIEKQKEYAMLLRNLHRSMAEEFGITSANKMYEHALRHERSVSKTSLSTGLPSTARPFDTASPTHLHITESQPTMPNFTAGSQPIATNYKIGETYDFWDLRQLPDNALVIDEPITRWTGSEWVVIKKGKFMHTPIGVGIDYAGIGVKRMMENEKRQAKKDGDEGNE